MCLCRSDPNAIRSLLNSVDVDYTNSILIYQDTRLAPQCYAFHLVNIHCYVDDVVLKFYLIATPSDSNPQCMR